MRRPHLPKRLAALWADVLMANCDHYLSGRQTFGAFAERNLAHWAAIKALGLKQQVFVLVDPAKCGGGKLADRCHMVAGGLSGGGK